MILIMLETDPIYATRYTYNYLNESMKQTKNMNETLRRYNGHEEYAGYIMNKCAKIRREFGL